MPHFIRRFFLPAVLGAVICAAPARAQTTFGNFAPGVTINNSTFDTSNTTNSQNWVVAFTTNASVQTQLDTLRLALSLPATASYGLRVFVTSQNFDNFSNSLVNFTTSDTLTTTPQAINLTAASIFTPDASTTYYLHVDSTTNLSNIRWNYVNDSPPTLSNYYSIAYGGVNATYLSSDRGGYYLTEVAVPEAAKTGLIIGVGALAAGLVLRRSRSRDKAAALS